MSMVVEALSPQLFNLVLEYMAQQVQAQDISLDQGKISLLGNADNLIIVITDQQSIVW